MLRDPGRFEKALSDLSDATAASNEARDAADKARRALEAEDARLKAEWQKREQEIAQRFKDTQAAADVLALREAEHAEAVTAVAKRETEVGQRETAVEARERAVGDRESRAGAIEAEAKKALAESNAAIAEARREDALVSVRRTRLADVLAKIGTEIADL